MSTATLERTGTVPTGGVPGRVARPASSGRPGHLRLVPTGAGTSGAALPGARAQSTPRPAAPSTPRPAAPSTPRPAAAVRITRRGRLALTSTATLVVALVLLSLMGVIGPAGASSSVVVTPGMTLTQVAAEQLPDVPLSQAVIDIQRANRLSTTSVAVGQELVIPGR